MVVVMDRGLLGLLLCLVVMCVAGAVGASIRLVFLVLCCFLYWLCFVSGTALACLIFVVCCCSVQWLCASLRLFGRRPGRYLIVVCYVLIVVFCLLFDQYSLYFVAFCF